MFNQKRFKEKAAMRKTLALHQEGSNKYANDATLMMVQCQHIY